ncbi:MAG: hypothetical protein IJS08_04325 [Victivallales bacterium]|nr:hypothetical protein [Victivallales bacterium]
MNSIENDKAMFHRGEITDELRKQLIMKRNALNLSYAKMWVLLGVNWSTVRKWETGETKLYTYKAFIKSDEYANESRPLEERIESWLESEKGMDYLSAFRLGKKMRYAKRKTQIA